MRNKLWTFGCSFTQGFLWGEFNNARNPMIDYYESMGCTFPPAWPEILADKLNLDVMNKGYSGSSCYKIFDEFCVECENFKKNDVVIVEWTRINRFRAVHGNGHFPTILPIFDENEPEKHPLPVKSIMEIQVNRSERPYVEEIYSFQNLIDEICKSFECEIYFWSADNLIINQETLEFKSKRKYLVRESNQDLTRYLVENYGATTLDMETNGLIKDGQHYGRDGHKIMADVFYDEIMKYRNNLYE
jgi:hypothetical protein